VLFRLVLKQIIGNLNNYRIIAEQVKGEKRND